MTKRVRPLRRLIQQFVFRCSELTERIAEEAAVFAPADTQTRGVMTDLAVESWKKRLGRMIDMNCSL